MTTMSCQNSQSVSMAGLKILFAACNRAKSQIIAASLSSVEMATVFVLLVTERFWFARNVVSIEEQIFLLPAPLGQKLDFSTARLNVGS